jgi:THO complex subunit 5
MAETATMTVRDIVTESTLLPVLQISADAHNECQQLLALIDPNKASTSAPTGAPSQDTIAAVSKQQKILYSLLAQLRGLNRDAILRVRETKQSTAEARQEIDRLHLQLQNLYYEQKHLIGEIAACESYEYEHPPSLAFDLFTNRTFIIV